MVIVILVFLLQVDNVDEPVEALDLRLTKFEDDYSNVENPLIEIKQEEEPGPGDNSAADNTAAAAGDNQQDSQQHLIKVGFFKKLFLVRTGKIIL